MSTKDWYIIEAGKTVTGPFTTEEVQAAKASQPPKTLLIKNGVEPIQVHDEIGFHEIISFGHLLESDNNAVSVLPTPVSRILSEPVAPEYVVVSTRGLSHKENSQTSKQPSARRVRMADLLRHLLHRNKNLLLLVALGAAALWAKPVETENQIQRLQKLSALAVEDSPTQVMNSLISAKLARKDLAYTRLLLKLQGMKDSFPANEVPSLAWTAALALTSLSREELDQSPQWKTMLKELNEQKTLPPLATMGYEASRINDLILAYSKLAQKLGVSEDQATFASPNKGFSLLWGAKVQKLGGAVIPLPALNEAWVSLKRIDDSFDKTLSQEQIFRDRIVARTLWNSLSLILLAPKSLPTRGIEAKLDFADHLSERLPATDQMILKQLSREVREQLSNQTDAAKILIARETMLSELQKDYSIFCQPMTSAVAADFVLQTISLQQKIGHNKSIVPRSVFNECLVGSASFLRTTPAEHRAIAATTLYLPSQTPSDLAIKTWGSPKVLSKADSVFSSESLAEIWKFYTKTSDHLPKVVMEKVKAFCKSASDGNPFCVNFYWHTSSSPMVNVKTLPAIAKLFPSTNVSAAAISLAANLTIQTDGGASIPTEIRAETLAKARSFINEVDDDTAALDWYEANRFAIKRRNP